VVLDDLVEGRSVRRAPSRIGLSQSAASHALERVRKVLDDELLMRTSIGMEPTPRALELAGPVLSRRDTPKLQIESLRNVCRAHTASDAHRDDGQTGAAPTSLLKDMAGHART
jgi:hypothetical protein